tara:strand:+ start:555 stop:761 length:207 start_codon:yes stop_codon:yes gene_type:complete
MSKTLQQEIDSLSNDKDELQKRITNLENILTEVCKRIGMDKEYDTWANLAKFHPKQRTLIPRDQHKIV